MKLDIGCGEHCQEGFEGVDIAPCKGASIAVPAGEPPRKHPDVKHVMNFLAFPWPFHDESVDEVFSSHVIEHIPQLFWTPPGALRTEGYCYTKPRDDETWSFEDALTSVQVSDQSVELLLKFFAEVWRVMKPGAKARILCPHGHSDRTWQDPSHRRCIVNATWDYLDHDWRRVNGLQHAAYSLRCHFPIAERHTSATGSPQQVQALRILPDKSQDAAVEKWLNMVSDFNVTIVKAPIPIAAPAVAEATSQAPAEAVTA